MKIYTSVVPKQVVDRYFEMAESLGGTSGPILDAMCVFARQEARELIRLGARKSDVANAFEQIAKGCHATALAEKWGNDYALGISDTIKEEVRRIK